VHKSATRNVRQPASCRTLLQDRSCTSGGHGEKIAAKTSTHAHTVPPGPPTTTAAAKTRTTTHVRPPVRQRGRHRSRRPLQSTRARRLLARAATAAAGDDGGRRHVRGCAWLLSRLRTGHGTGADASNAASPPNGPKVGSTLNTTAPDDPAAPPPSHCAGGHRGAGKPPARPFSTVSQVARLRRTPPKQAAALDSPLARGGSGRRLCCPHAQGPAGYAQRDAAFHAWPAGPAGLAQPPQCSLRHV